MSKISNIRVLMDKTLHHVPRILTTRLIKHKSIKGTKVVQRESLDTFNYRKAFYTTTAIIILLSVGIGYGIFAAMNIGLTKEEVKANLMNQFVNSNDIDVILDRKEVNPLTYVFNKDLDNNKVYTFTGAGDSTVERDVTSNVYHIKDTTPMNVPTTVKRAYSKEDVEANYTKSVDGVELKGLETDRERSPNTYILKKNFDEQTVYAFSGSATQTTEHPVTSSVFHVEDNLPEFVPTTVKRAYSKQDIENNYVKRLEGNTLRGLDTAVEVDPNTYILKNALNSNQIYSISGIGANKKIVDSTSSILYKSDNKNEKLPQSIVTRGYAKDEIESTYIRPYGVKDLEGLETKSALDPRLYTWDYKFSLDTAYTFNGKILAKKVHVVTSNLYYVTDEKPKLVPTGIKRAYLKQDVEKNYVLKSGELNLEGIEVLYERTELSNEHVYSFSGDGIDKAKDVNQITRDVRYVGEKRPDNVPTGVTRVYTASEIETNYVLGLDKNNIGVVKALKEVNPNTYIKKNTLASDIYYEASGEGNNLIVNPFLISKGEIYRATNQLSSNEDLTLELLDFKNKTYLNSYDSNEGLYVLDNTDSFVSTLKPTNHIEKETYEVAGDGGNTNIIMSDEEVLALDNKIALFQKEKLTNPFDRYGNFNWWGLWSTYAGHRNVLSCDIHLESYSSALRIANSYLPYGVNLTDKEIKYITSNIGAYKLRLYVGSGLPENKYSYGILMRADGTEWDGVEKFYQDITGTEDILPAEFPENAETKREDYRWWDTRGNGKYQTIRIALDYTYENFHTVNKDVNLYFDGKEKNTCKSFTSKSGSTLDHRAIRGIQVYKDPSLT